MRKHLEALPHRIRDLVTELQTPGSPNSTAAVTYRAQALKESARCAIKEEKREVAERYRVGHLNWNGIEPTNPVPANSSRHTGAMRTGAVAAFGLECVFGSVLASTTFNLSLWPAVSVGILITVGLTLIVKATWFAIAVKDEDRPRNASSRLDRQLSIVFPLWLVTFIAALLVGRTLSEATSLNVFVFGSLMTLLTILSPIMTAILLNAAGLRGWATHHVKEWQYLEQLEFDLHELEVTCQYLENRFAERAPGHANEVKTAPKIAVVTSVLLLAMASQGIAQPATGELWVDLSGSLAKAELQEAVGQFLALAPTVADQWELYGFAGGAYFATPFYRLTFPAKPIAACAPVGPKNDVVAIFQSAAKAEAARQEQACVTALRTRQEEYRKAVSEQSSIALLRLENFTPRDPKRTCIVDLLARLSASKQRRVPHYVLILTDASETCEPSFSGPIPPPSPPISVVMAVVPPERRGALSPRRYFSEAERHWSQAAPWVSVIPINLIDPAMFTMRRQILRR